MIPRSPPTPWSFYSNFTKCFCKQYSYCRPSLLFVSPMNKIVRPRSIPHSTAVETGVWNPQFADFFVRNRFADFPPLYLGFLYTTKIFLYYRRVPNLLNKFKLARRRVHLKDEEPVVVKVNALGPQQLCHVLELTPFPVHLDSHKITAIFTVLISSSVADP